MNSISHPQDYTKYINELLYLSLDNKNTLTSIELWGGEPLLGLNEFLIYLSEFIRIFSNLNTIQLSTNLSLDNSANLINSFSEQLYNLRPFAKIKLQISIDGPEWLNDFNRGTGTTNKVIQNISQLDLQYENLEIVTNSILYTKGLYGILSYEDMENWFNFFLNNFPEVCRFGFFKFAQLENGYNNEDGARAAQLLAWADTWRESHPEEAQRFIWPDYKSNILNVCAAADPNDLLALSPDCQRAICHRGIGEAHYDLNVMAINITSIRDQLMNSYHLYKDKISLEDFKDSVMIYINLMWCPYLSTQPRDFYGDRTWFFNAMPLYYNGAMNTLLKWSRQYGQN